MFGKNFYTLLAYLRNPGVYILSKQVNLMKKHLGHISPQNQQKLNLYYMKNHNYNQLTIFDLLQFLYYVNNMRV